MVWEQLAKPAHAAAQSTMTLRGNGSIALSVKVVKEYDLDGFSRVSILVDRERFALGLRFHNDESDEGSYAVVNDGGGKTRDSRGKVIQAQAVLRKVPFVMATVKDGPRRIVPRREKDVFVLEVGPGFQEVANYPADVPSDAEGVYRYVRSSGDREEIVYIGRGKIRSRMQDPQREAWRYDRVEWSPVRGIEGQTEWEYNLLEVHKRKHSGKLPEYNKVSGAG